MPEILTTNDLVIGYDRPLSAPLNLAIPPRVGVGIIGANGSGKSTLVKTLAGLLSPLGGTYRWEGTTRLGYVPQEDQVSPLLPLTVMDLLNMGRHALLPRLQFSTRDFEASAHRVLEEMEIVRLRNTLVSELSRGQRQRALIARGLIGGPHVLLLDEPYSALDDPFRKKLHEVFEERRRSTRFSFFIIEHDLNRVINQVDWVIVLGSHGTLCGSKSAVLNQQSLSRAYGSKLHLHEENGEIQVHFL